MDLVMKKASASHSVTERITMIIATQTANVHVKLHLLMIVVNLLVADH